MPDMLQVQKQRAFLKRLTELHKLALELYEKGGNHPKDLALAHAYSDLVYLYTGLFPELGDN